MKKTRWTTLLIAIFTGMLFFSASVLIAAAKQKAAPEITLEGKDYAKDKKGPVKFTHEKHAKDFKIACTECHHVYKDGKNVWTEDDKESMKCSACHDPKEKKGEVDKLQNAYHKNCKNCHKALEAEGKKTGPFKKCNGCHAKR